MFCVSEPYLCSNSFSPIWSLLLNMKQYVEKGKTKQKAVSARPDVALRRASNEPSILITSQLVHIWMASKRYDSSRARRTALNISLRSNNLNKLTHGLQHRLRINERQSRTTMMATASAANTSRMNRMLMSRFEPLSCCEKAY